MRRFPLATLAVLPLLVLTVAACQGNGGGPSGANGSSTLEASDNQQTPSPTPFPLPTLTPFPSAVEQQIEQIKELVAEIRGLPAPTLKRQGLLSVDTLRASSLEALGTISEEDLAEVEAFEQVTAMLGLIPAGYSVEDLYSDYATQIAGFYSREDDAFVVVNETPEELSKSQELTIAHELTHAIQDETFNLDEFQKRYEDHEQDREGYTDYGNLSSCVTEGDAVLTQIKYAESRFGRDWRKEIRDDRDIDESEPYIELPPFMEEQSNFNYSQCYLFVEQVYEEGGWDGVNDLYTNPPATQEQVMDFEKYQAREVAGRGVPDGLEARLPGWTEGSASGQFGEFDTGAYIRALSDDDSFLGALYGYALGGIGWDSGWVRHYSNPTNDRRLVQISLAFESSEYRDDFLSVFAPIAVGFGADIEIPDLFEFDSDEAPPIEAGETISWSDGPSAGPYGFISVYSDHPGLDIFVATDEETLAMVTP